MSKLAILFMTKETEGRLGVAVRTIRALSNLHFHGHIKFFIADGGSSPEYTNQLVAELLMCGHEDIQVHTRKDVPAGAMWNWAISEIFEQGFEIYMRLEDDFVLKDTLPLQKYLNVFERRKDVGMIRLGLMPIGLDLHSTSDKENIYFDCLPTTNYAYSGNPGLVHKRLHDHVGFFNESMNPGDIEIDFDYRIRQALQKDSCPRIWYPLDLGAYGTYGPWDHIGQVKSY